METHIGFVPIVTMVSQKLKHRGKSKKGKLCISNQQGERAGQGRVEMGPELLKAVPAQVIGKMGPRPVFQLYCFREPSR